MQAKSTTAMAGYAQVFAHVLESRGVDYRAVFTEAGVQLEDTIDPLHRITSEQVSRLFEVSVRVTDDPYLGIAIGNAFQPGHFHALGYGLLASTTLRDFYERVEKYYRIASQNADFTHFQTDSAAILCASQVNQNTCGEAQDVWAAAMLRLMRMAYQKPLKPLYVEFKHDCPEPGSDPYEESFGCEVRFGAERISIALDPLVMDERLPAASEELAMFNDRIVMEYLGKLDKADVVTTTRRLIVKGLSAGRFSKEAIAKELNMSPRNLQLKLAVEDASFQELLEESRRELAMHYMKQQRMQITEIAFLLGYTDASNFTRAFRRWTGLSPRQFRAGQAS